MTDLEIFHNAPESASPEELAAYLDQACGDDSDLREKVEALLAARTRTDDFLEDGALQENMPTIGLDGGSSGKGFTPSGLAPLLARNEKQCDVIGPFTLVEILGEGGFGTVWKAEQSEPISRTVALKILKVGMDTHEILTRFEGERQALARMDHVNIAKVLDAGATENGRPFFVMELVEGVPITKYCDGKGLDTKARLELFRDVCAAVNHAHQKGMIHRDLKPSNVMVGEQDGKPIVKVIDFGISKSVEGKLTEETLVTMREQMMGTPAYMSPEQAGIAELDIDTRSDIYSLGVLLYELLSGKPPFDPKTLMAASYEEMRRIIREEEPARPSLRVSTISNPDETANFTTTHGSEPEKLSRQLRGDLDWIVMKAIEKDRGRRYETANAFAEDLRRFLTDQPVSAAAPSMGYQFRKFARRNRTGLAVGATIAAVLVVATCVSVWQAVRATNAEAIAVAQSSELRLQLYDSDMMRASQVAAVSGGLRSALRITDRWQSGEGETDLRGWEWYMQRSTEEANTRIFYFPGREEKLNLGDLLWFPDSRRFLAFASHRVVIWDIATRMRLATMENGDAAPRAVAISPAGDRLAVAWDSDEVTVHEADSGSRLFQFSVSDQVIDVGWEEDSKTIVTVSKSKIQFWHSDTGEEVASAVQVSVHELAAFSPDGSKLAYLTKRHGEAFSDEVVGVGVNLSRAANGLLTIVAVSEGTPAAAANLRTNDVILEIDEIQTDQLSRDEISDAVRGAKGTPVVLRIRRTADRETTTFETTLVRDVIKPGSPLPGTRLGIVNARTGEPVYKKDSSLREFWRFRRIRWNEDSTSLIAVSVYGGSSVFELGRGESWNSTFDGYDCVWRGPEHQSILAPPRHSGLQFRIANDPERTIDSWNTNTETEISAVAMSPDRKWILSAERNGNLIRAWPISPTASVPMVVNAEELAPRTITWTPRAAEGKQRNWMVGWNREGPGADTVVDFWSSYYYHGAASWSPDHTRLAVLHDRGTTPGPGTQLEVWNEFTGLVEHRRTVPGAIRWVKWNDDGNRLAVRTHPSNPQPGGLSVLDGSTYRELWYRYGTPNGIWLPNGNGILLSEMGDLLIADQDTGDLKQSILPTSSNFFDAEKRMVLALSPDGSQVASGATNQSVTIWDTDSWKILKTLWLGEPIEALDWSPDGSRLAVGTDEAIRIWNPDRGSEVLRISEAGARSLSWSPDGLILASAKHGVPGGYLWDSRPARRAESFTDFVAAAGSGQWKKAARSAEKGLSRYQRPSDDPWFHAGWWSRAPETVQGTLPQRTGYSLETGHSFRLPSGAPEGSWRKARLEADGVVVAAESTDESWHLSRYYIDTEETLEIHLAATSPGRLWLNGKPIYNSKQNPIGRAVLSCQPVPGWNDFVVALTKPELAGGLQLRPAIPDSGPTPFRDFVYITEPTLTEERRRGRILAAISDDPANPQTWRNLAAVEIHHEKLNAAEKALKRAYDLDPFHQRVFRLAVALLEARNKTGREKEINDDTLLVGRIIDSVQFGSNVFATVPASAPPDDEEVANALNEWAAWIPHAERNRWISRWQLAFGKKAPAQSALPSDWHRRARVQFSLGELEEGIAALESLVAPDGKANEVPDSIVSEGLSILRNEVDAFKRERHYDQAIELGKRTLALSLRFYGSQHQETLRTMGTLGQTYNWANRAEEGIELLEKRRELAKQNYGIDSEEYWWNMDDLASCYQKAGRKKEAVELAHAILHHSDAPWSRIGPLGILANFHEQEGRLEKALEYREARLSARKQANSDHRHILTERHHLAILRFRLGQKEEALKLREELVAQCRDNLEPEDELTFQIVNALASSYSDAARWEDALPLWKEALDFSRNKHGPGHATTLYRMTSLALACRETGQRNRERDLREAELGGWLKLKGEQDPVTIGAMERLAMCLFQTGDLEKALELRERQLPLSIKVHGPDTVKTTSAMIGLATCYRDCGRHAEAIELFEKALKIRIGKLGKADKITWSAMGYLAGGYQKAGQIEKANGLRAQLNELRTKAAAQ